MRSALANKWRVSSRLFSVVFLLSSAIVVIGGVPAGAATSAPSIGIDHDPAGSSWYPEQTGLSRALLAGGSFGQLFATPLTGLIQGQPLVVGATLLVSTEANNAYGLNAATGAVNWTKALGTTFSSAALGCADLPQVGVTGTPVVDPVTATEYLLAKTYVSGTSGPGAYWMHALDVATGNERAGFPVQIAGTAANDAHQSFSATYQLQRPGLVLLGGVVYAAFGGHCDLPPYHGWIAGVSEAGKVTTLWTDEAGVDTGNLGLGGIWAPGALRSDGPGQLIFSSGNGNASSAPLAGKTPPPELAQTVSRLSVQANGSLKATDFFMPWDATSLNKVDGDLGSGSPVLLPPAQFGTVKYPHLAVEIGKEGYLYILNADNLGGYKQGPAGGDDVIARLGPVQGLWGSPAVWGGDGGYIYFVDNGDSGGPGSDGHLLAWKFGVDGAGKPTFAQVGASPDAFAYGGSSPVVTSSGTTSGTGILWVNWAGGEGTVNGQLRAYNPIPVNGQLQQLWNAPSGAAVRLAEPGVGNNRIYLGGYDGVIRGFGTPVQYPLVGTAVSFPATAIGKTLTKTATFTATKALTVTAISSSSGYFKFGTAAPALPAVLAANASMSVPVTFTPAVASAVGGTITVTTSVGPYRVGVSGEGFSAGASLSAAPFAVTFEGTAVGASTTEPVIIANHGAQALHFTAVTPPPAPFSSANLPAVGSVLAARASLTVNITIKPTVAGQYFGSFTLTSDTGGSATVALSGISGSGAIEPVLGPPAAGGWTMRGAATMSGSTLVLNPFTTNQVGSAEGPVAVATDGLSVSFDALINGAARGADGMTLTLADPSSPTMLGGSGGALGYCGIKGVAVGLVTFKGTGEPSSNFIGVTGSCTGGVPSFAATSTTIPALQNATTHVAVSIAGQQLTVKVGGVQVLQTTMAGLPADAELVFTGSTGALIDSHAVNNVTITQPVLNPPAAGGWTLRGNATMSGPSLVLNPLAVNTGGSAQGPATVATNGLTVAFDAVITGGTTGANGLTLTLADPSSTTMLGGTGGALGYCGIKGVAVALVTYQYAGGPSNNFVGVASSCGVGAPTFSATSTKIPVLQNATTRVTVSIAGQQLTVSVAGVQVLQTTVAALTAQADVVFTASSGGVTDIHAVNNVTITETT